LALDGAAGFLDLPAVEIRAVVFHNEFEGLHKNDL
jgi:hypothetical protein